MIHRTTHPNKEYNTESNATVGRSFSLIDRVKRNGVGSKRLIIEELSDGLNPKQIQFSELDYGNIELRPKGIIVHFTNRLERYSWIIPYYRLALYDATYFSIHAEGQFIRFRKNKTYVENKTFISKMITAKSEFLNQGYYDG